MRMIWAFAVALGLLAGPALAQDKKQDKKTGSPKDKDHGDKDKPRGEGDKDDAGKGKDKDKPRGDDDRDDAGKGKPDKDEPGKGKGKPGDKKHDCGRDAEGAAKGGPKGEDESSREDRIKKIKDHFRERHPDGVCHCQCSHGEGGSKSGVKGNNGLGNGEDPQPPGTPPVNDGPGSGPGDPGNRKK